MSIMLFTMKTYISVGFLALVTATSICAMQQPQAQDVVELSFSLGPIAEWLSSSGLTYENLVQHTAQQIAKTLQQVLEEKIANNSKNHDKSSDPSLKIFLQVMVEQLWQTTFSNNSERTMSDEPNLNNIKLDTKSLAACFGSIFSAIVQATDNLEGLQSKSLFIALQPGQIHVNCEQDLGLISPLDPDIFQETFSHKSAFSQSVQCTLFAVVLAIIVFGNLVKYYPHLFNKSYF